MKPCNKSHIWNPQGIKDKCEFFICEKCGCWKFVNPKNGKCFYTDAKSYEVAKGQV